MSPTPAEGNLFRRPLMPMTAITYKFFPPTSGQRRLERGDPAEDEMCTLTSVIGTVDHCSDWQTKGDAEFSSRGSSASCKEKHTWLGDMKHACALVLYEPRFDIFMEYYSPQILG